MVLGGYADPSSVQRGWQMMSKASFGLRTVAAEATERWTSPDQKCQELNATLPKVPVWQPLKVPEKLRWAQSQGPLSGSCVLGGGCVACTLLS